MQEDRNCCSCNNGGLFSGIFGGNGCGCDSKMLFFIIIFLLLFTGFGSERCC